MSEAWLVVAGAAGAGLVVLALPPRPRPLRRVPRPHLAWATPVLVTLPWLLPGRSALLALVLGVAAWAVAVLAGRSRGRRRADATRAQVVEACEALASELRAGQPPPEALVQAALVWPPLATAVAAARLDAEVPDALRELARVPGAEPLAEVAAAWQVARRSGVGLARAVDRCADAARAAMAGHRVVAAELASAQATARMIVAMPVLLLLLADGGAGASIRFLAATDAGLVCLAAGLALAIAGLFWIDRIVTRVQGGS